MSDKSLKKQILEMLERASGWKGGNDIERFAIRRGYKASNGSRRARELAEEGKIRRDYTDEGYVKYKKPAKEPEQKKLAI